MNKTEFLQELRDKLAEELSPAAVNSHIQYYDSYISGATGAGKSESEVLDELGDPLLIAHTILDAQEAGTKQYDNVEYTSSSDTSQSTHSTQTEQQDSQNYGTGQSAFFGGGGKYGCLIAAIIMILVVVVVVSLIGSVISFLWPVLVPVLIIVLILSIFKTKGR